MTPLITNTPRKLSSRLFQVLELARIVIEHPSWLRLPEHRAMVARMAKRVFGDVRASQQQVESDTTSTRTVASVRSDRTGELPQLERTGADGKTNLVIHKVNARTGADGKTRKVSSDDNSTSRIWKFKKEVAR